MEGLGARKKFGQNFLINPAARQALVDALGGDISAGEEVWEIGPGLGAMTSSLLQKGLAVRAFEIDPGFIRALKKIFDGQENLSLVEGDVMKTLPCLFQSSGQNQARFLLGNLPYNIAAALIANLIERGCLFTRMVITVQKEVALRMAARSGSRDYSSFSVLCASAYNVKPLMTIHPASFYPRPNVDSMGVLFEKKTPGNYPAVFYPLVRALFASRRKTIRNNLAGLAASKKTLDAVLGENGLSGDERAENLDLEVFLSLAKSMENMRIYDGDVSS